MAAPLVPDELWELIKPHLPGHTAPVWGGRPPVPDRKALTGIIFVLKSGIPWEMLPREMGCGSGMTCWRRLRDWQQAGVWDTVKQVPGPNPTDRRKPGTKHHVITDAGGIPLKTEVTGANRHDVTQLLSLVDEIPAVKGKPGRPRRRPEEVYADRAYDSDPHRQELRHRHIEPHLARRNEEHGSGLGVYRWVSERALAWLHGFRRLRTRYERRADIHEAFVTMAECLICYRHLATARAGP